MYYTWSENATARHCRGNRMNASIIGYSFVSISGLPSSFPRTQPTQSASERGLVLREFCKIGDFFVRTRQRRVFVRNILKYVSSKNAPITPPARKGGFCEITAKLQEGCRKSLFFLALFIRLSCRHCWPVCVHLRGIKTKRIAAFSRRRRVRILLPAAARPATGRRTGRARRPGSGAPGGPAC